MSYYSMIHGTGSRQLESCGRSHRRRHIVSFVDNVLWHGLLVVLVTLLVLSDVKGGGKYLLKGAAGSRLGGITNTIATTEDILLPPNIRSSTSSGHTLLATEVTTQIRLLQIIDVDELRSNFRADLILEMTWYDPAMNISAATADLPAGVQSIDLHDLCVDDSCLRFPFFVPNVHFLNAVEITYPSTPISNVALYAGGIITRRVKVSGTFRINHLDLSDFPQDKHWMHFELGSFGYPPSVLYLKPIPGTPMLFDNHVYGRNNAWEVMEGEVEARAVLDIVYDTQLSFPFRVMRRSRIRFFRDVLPVYVVLVLIGLTFVLKLELGLDRFSIVLTLLLSLSALTYVSTAGLPLLDTFSRLDIFLLWAFCGTMLAAVAHLTIMFLRVRHLLLARIINAVFLILFLYAATLLVAICFVVKDDMRRIAIAVITLFFGLLLIPVVRYIQYRFKKDSWHSSKGKDTDHHMMMEMSPPHPHSNGDWRPMAPYPAEEATAPATHAKSPTQSGMNETEFFNPAYNPQHHDEVLLSRLEGSDDEDGEGDKHSNRSEQKGEHHSQYLMGVMRATRPVITSRLATTQTAGMRGTRGGLRR